MMAGFPNNKEAIPKELRYMQMIQESCLFKVGLSGIGGKKNFKKASNFKLFNSIL